MYFHSWGCGWGDGERGVKTFLLSGGGAQIDDFVSQIIKSDLKHKR